ncbi:SPFH domain-containing protein [Moheibacter stercoris]|uniref:Membrane protease subunit (Stomatin/prohibitin family) n=1 Tax=Moheibacter stercoris TaxID=1628251 RepID=A0ABV2LUU6_9FLAO
MAVFNFFKNEFIEVIEWVDSTSDTVIWKFPDYKNDIKDGAKLIVRESQVAVLIHEGQFGDLYKSGNYELNTQNMPILTTLKSWKYAFNSPFKVDVYFINTKQFTNLKWGTSSPIFFKDNELGKIRLKSFGNYSIRVTDPKKFILEFSGTNPFVKINFIENTVSKMIASQFADEISEAQISLFDLAQNFNELGTKFKDNFQDEFANFGLELEKFYIESVSLPEEVEQMIDKSSQLNILKDKLQDFSKLQTGVAIEKISENQGAGALGASVLLNAMPKLNSQINESSNSNDLLDLLKKLKDFKNQGIISEKEFESKKAEILKKL